MGRPPTFDRQQVLDAAVRVFWEKGYESASMADLERGMGIGRASLYHAFGSKRELFAEVLRRYGEVLDRDLLAPLRRPGPARRVLADFFRQLVDARASGAEPCCLAIKSAVTTARADRETARWVAEVSRALEEAFFVLLERARADGELAKGRNVRALARFFASTVEGLAVTASARRDRRVLQDVVRTALATLD